MSVGRRKHYRVEKRPAWRRWVTPELLRSRAIHRWYVFPHSFAAELVHALLDQWQLGPDDRIVDPFVGAGTTVLAAKEKGIPATGYDLSPHAVMTARVKVANYALCRLQRASRALAAALDTTEWNGPTGSYSDLVRRALPGKLLSAFEATAHAIESIPYSRQERDFLHTALLSALPEFSRARATGGWLKWMRGGMSAQRLPRVLRDRIEAMLTDLARAGLPRRSLWHVRQSDARRLPDADGTYSAVITSPPYPNRHDYTRVFGVELMLTFLDWEGARRLRRQSFHSHPEAKPDRPAADGYEQPVMLGRALAKITKRAKDPRVPRMLEGYFLDAYLCLGEMARVCRPHAHVALVVGNAQYCGVSVLVDRITAEIAEQVGLRCDRIVAVRYRGNSAQQMGTYGRRPSRESVVLFRRT